MVDYEVEGIVSLWIGNVNCEEDFFNLLEEEFNEDEDSIGCEFTRVYGIDYYEEDKREADVLKADSLAEFLEGVSYDSKVIPRFEKMGVEIFETDNAILLLYDVKYEGVKKKWINDVVDLRYIGWVNYL